VVEGARSVAEALVWAAEGGEVHELFVTGDAARRHPDLVSAANDAGVAVSTVTEQAAAALSETVTPSGLVAVCSRVDVPLTDALAGTPRLVAVLVEVAEPGNAGTVIRVADAAGADAVVLAGHSVDPHNGKSVRASVGSIFHLPVAVERDVDAVLDGCRGAGLQLLAGSADGELDLDDADDVLAAPTAWVFGGEAHGLPAAVSAAADHRVRVPIHGRAESLNLATAAAVCLYASARAHARRRA
jgi:TrmH family RNA methyltransferase